MHCNIGEGCPCSCCDDMGAVKVWLHALTLAVGWGGWWALCCDLIKPEGKQFCHALNWRPGEPHSLDSCRESNHDSSGVKLIAQSLSWLHCNVCCSCKSLRVSFIPPLSHVMTLSVKPVISVCILSQPYAAYCTPNLPLKHKRRKRKVRFLLKNSA